MRREEEYQDYDEDAEPQRETGQAEGRTRGAPAHLGGPKALDD